VTKAKAIDRVRKLLALATSNNASEAATAKSQAQRLMRKYGITDDDVASPDEISFEMSLGFGFEPQWKFSLVSAAARRCDCMAVGRWRSNSRKVIVVGSREDAMRTLTLFTSLLNEIGFIVKRERRLPPEELIADLAIGVHHNLRSYLRSFHEGIVTFILPFTRYIGRPPCRSTPPSTSRDLIVFSKKSKVLDHIRSKFKSLKKLPPDCGEFDQLAHDRGFVAASRSRKLWQLLERE